MSVYRLVLVWLLRAGGSIGLALTAFLVVTTLQMLGAYERGEPGITYLLDLVGPVGGSLVIASLAALAVAEILALLIKRSSAK